MRKRSLSLEEQRKRWYDHVSRTPSGHVPVLFSGIPAWQISPGPASKVLEHFRAVSPVEYWPSWIKHLQEDLKPRDIDPKGILAPMIANARTAIKVIE